MIQRRECAPLLSRALSYSLSVRRIKRDSDSKKRMRERRAKEEKKREEKREEGDKHCSSHLPPAWHFQPTEEGYGSEKGRRQKGGKEKRKGDRSGLGSSN